MSINEESQPVRAAGTDDISILWYMPMRPVIGKNYAHEGDTWINSNTGQQYSLGKTPDLDILLNR